MGAQRERRPEDQPEDAPEHVAETPPAVLPVPPASGLSRETLNRANVIALQRLVGNAAVVEIMDAQRPAEPEVDGEQSRRDSAAGDLQASVADGVAHAVNGGAPADRGLPAAGAALELAASDTGAMETQANGSAPGAAGAEPHDAVDAERPAAAGGPAPAAVPTAGPGAADGAAPAAAAPGTAAAAGGAVGAGAAAPTGAAAPADAGGAAAPAAAEPPAAAPPAPADAGETSAIRDPHADPRFTAMKGAANSAGARAKAHQPAAAGAATAQGAAVPPGNEVASKAAAAQVDEMGAQEPGSFDRAAFMAAVRKSIDAAAPKNMEEADDLKESGKVAQVKEEVGGLVTRGKQRSEQNIKQATVAPPDPSKVTPKTVVPMANDQPGQPPGHVGAAEAMPLPRPPEDTDLSAGPAAVEQEMAASELTEEQLQTSNEPQFTAALDARQAVRQHAQTAPGEYRAQEQEVLGESQDEARGIAATQLQGMYGSRAQTLGKVLGHKGTAKAADEGKRAMVAADIQRIYDGTKRAVGDQLDALGRDVDDTFTKGEAAARKQFEDEVGARMDAYKDDRYGGWWGWTDWLADKVSGMPAEVNVFYVEGRDKYLAQMEAVIGAVADIVVAGLNAARTRIAEGRGEVRTYVAKLPEDLAEVGKEAEGKLDTQFEELEADVDAKQNELVDAVAHKYVEASESLDKRIEKLKEENQGLVQDAIGLYHRVKNAVIQLKDLLFSTLSKFADVIPDIILHPIRFLGHLFESATTGFKNFAGKIETHLQDSLVAWLLGTLGEARIKLPASLDLAGVFDVVAQILELSREKIRDRVAKLIGAPAVATLEKNVTFFTRLFGEGISSLWELVSKQLSNFEDLVLGPIKKFVVESVIKAGVPTLLAMLNPATAFIRACIAIYDFVQFLFDQGPKVLQLINDLLDSISAIAHGQIDAAAAHIETTLKGALTLAISLLAKVMRLGNLPEKIKSIIETVRKPIRKVVDTIVLGAVKGAKHLFARPATLVKKGKTYVKGKAEAGKKWVKEKSAVALGWMLEKLGLVEVKEDFDMQGEDHTVTARAVPDKRVEVTMASHVAVALKDLVADAIKTLKGSKDKDKSEAVGILEAVGSILAVADEEWDKTSSKLKERLRALPKNVKASDRSINRQAAPQLKAGEEKLRKQVKLAVTKIRHIKAPSITALLKTLGGRRVFPPTFINVEGRFRRKLYDKPADWPTTRKNFYAANEPEFTAKIKELQKASGKPVGSAEYKTARDEVEVMQGRWSADPKVAKKLVAGGRLNEGALKAFEKGRLEKYYLNTYYEVDHIVPLALHWYTTGYMSDDDDRARHAGRDDSENLQFLTKDWNGDKSGKDDGGKAHFYYERPYVEDPFKSAAEGEIDWLKVDKT